jgi:hypothetical protein
MCSRVNTFRIRRTSSRDRVFTDRPVATQTRQEVLSPNAAAGLLRLQAGQVRFSVVMMPPNQPDRLHTFVSISYIVRV